MRACNSLGSLPGSRSRTGKPKDGGEKVLVRNRKHTADESELEHLLSRSRREAPAELVGTISRSIGAIAGRERHGRARLGVAAALTTAMVAALAAFGGIGSAASSVGHTTQVLAQVVHITSPKRPNAPIVVRIPQGLSSAADQYSALTFHGNSGGANQPPLTALAGPGTKYSHVTVPLTLTSDLRLTIKVYNSKGQLVRTGTGKSKVATFNRKAGNVLLRVIVPTNLPAGAYRIVISALDPKTGKLVHVTIGFSA
jgi:hypothetical protein